MIRSSRQPRYADDWRDIPVEEASKAVELAEEVMGIVLPKLGPSAEDLW